ncbi:hypothetical protein [Chlamydiifrater volucris]|nr:hypothetical protein [Chlamydiifrater volucris]
MTITFLSSASLLGLSVAGVVALPAALFGIQSSYLIAALLIATALVSLSLAIACTKSWNKFSRVL